MENKNLHKPVMLTEVLFYLAPKSGGVYFDGTVGTGGHAEAILSLARDTAQTLTVIGVDSDPAAVAVAKERLSPFGESATIDICHADYTEISEVIEKNGIDSVDGMLLDLGIGSHQLLSRERGFSIDLGGPLDMRYDTGRGISASEVVNRLPQGKLAKIIRDLGGERKAHAVARAIVWERKKKPIRDAHELARIVARVTGGTGKRRGRIHPATRTFMALRIYVNNELEKIATFIDTGSSLLKPNGRIVIISYHSLEDGIVKRAFKKLALADDAGERSFSILTKKPISPGPEEIRENPRARSAKLRAAGRIPHGC
jgi:16S rRNA (cytosine1402-N4)-methyltransferase